VAQEERLGVAAFQIEARAAPRPVETVPLQVFRLLAGELFGAQRGDQVERPFHHAAIRPDPRRRDELPPRLGIILDTRLADQADRPAAIHVRERCHVVRGEVEDCLLAQVV